MSNVKLQMFNPVSPYARWPKGQRAGAIKSVLHAMHPSTGLELEMEFPCSNSDISTRLHLDERSRKPTPGMPVKQPAGVRANGRIVEAPVIW